MHLILLENNKRKNLAFFTHHSSKIKLRKLGLVSLSKRETKDPAEFIAEFVISDKGHILLQFRLTFFNTSLGILALSLFVSNLRSNNLEGARCC